MTFDQWYGATELRFYDLKPFASQVWEAATASERERCARIYEKECAVTDHCEWCDGVDIGEAVRRIRGVPADSDTALAPTTPDVLDENDADPLPLAPPVPMPPTPFPVPPEPPSPLPPRSGEHATTDPE